MKLSLTQLESARADPNSMRASLRSTAKVHRSFSRARALYLSAMRYHKENEDLGAARDYLTEMYRRNFKRPEELPVLLKELTAYARAYQSMGNEFVSAHTRINISVTDEFELSGEISRVDLVATGGYAVWLFSRGQHLWKNELRMPIIQHRFAQTLGVDAQEIIVGFYFFSASIYDSECYTRAAIDNALRECGDLGRILTA